MTSILRLESNPANYGDKAIRVGSIKNNQTELFLPNSRIRIANRKTDSCWLFRKVKSQWVFNGIVMACVCVRWNDESLIVQWILRDYWESFFWRCIKNRLSVLDVFGSPFWHRAGMRCNDVLLTEPSVLRVNGWFLQKIESLWIVWRWMKNRLIFLDVFDRSFRTSSKYVMNDILLRMHSVLRVCRWLFQRTESLSIFQRCIDNQVNFLDVFDKSFRQHWGMWCSAVLVLMQSSLQVYGEFSENSILVDWLAFYQEWTERAWRFGQLMFTWNVRTDRRAAGDRNGPMDALGRAGAEP